jgi:hypothetical protein
VTAIWDRLHASAEARTLVDPATGEPIGAEALRNEMFNDMYNPHDWFALSSRLADLAAGSSVRTVATRAAGDTVPDPYPAIWCSDWHWRVSGFHELDLYRRALQRIAPHTRLSPFWSDVTSCLGWSGRVSNPQHRLDVHGAPTILIVKADFDVATPHEWNFAVARQIHDSVLLQYDGVGHGQFRNSTCARADIENYLITRTAPAKGTHCPVQDPVQFTVTTAPQNSTERPLH